MKSSGSLALCGPPKMTAPASGRPAAAALVGFEGLEHEAARQELRHEADDLVADAGNDQPLAGHEAVIARLRDLVGGAVEQARGPPRIDAGAHLEFGLHR